MQSASQHLDELEWTQWPSDQIAARGKAQWKELLGSHSGCQNDMTMGVVRLRKGESLEPHRGWNTMFCACKYFLAFHKAWS
jgi:hypothetical protein